MKYHTCKCTGLHPDKLPNECGAIFLPNRHETCPKCGANYFCDGPVIDLPDLSLIHTATVAAINIVIGDTWPGKKSELLDLLISIDREMEGINEDNRTIA